MWETFPIIVVKTLIVNVGMFAVKKGWLKVMNNDISAATMATIQKAKDSLQAAHDSVANHKDDVDKLQEAIQTEHNSLVMVNEALKKANNDAHAALDALSVELELEMSTPVTPVTPVTPAPAPVAPPTPLTPLG